MVRRALGEARERAERKSAEQTVRIQSVALESAANGIINIRQNRNKRVICFTAVFLSISFRLKRGDKEFQPVGCVVDIFSALL